MGAEGFGAAAQGGRRYDIYRVNQLVDEWTWGTLRWALWQAQTHGGGGIIVFDVAGPIILNEKSVIGFAGALPAGASLYPDITDTRILGDVITRNPILLPLSKVH